MQRRYFSSLTIRNDTALGFVQQIQSLWLLRKEDLVGKKFGRKTVRIRSRVIELVRFGKSLWQRGPLAPVLCSSRPGGCSLDLHA